ncbi:hypothetical protein ABHV46_08685 [Asaia sp. BMEF1]|uniref:hypothetical protein n=1 Tax=Asaia sp. BMEF1 TaxID=3155932 RepID=UPI003F676E92
MSSPTLWTDRQGAPIACVEKLKVLRENETELRQTLQDVFEDALLMGVDPDAMRQHLVDMVAALKELNA